MDTVLSIIAPLGALLLLDAISHRHGHDSCDGRDWHLPDGPRP